MILYEGEYSGILEPWRHYIPLRKDHANMAEVAKALTDGVLCDRIVNTAYREIALNPKFQWKAMVDLVDREVERMAKQKKYGSCSVSRIRRRLWRIPSLVTVRRRAAMRLTELLHRWVFGTLFRQWGPDKRRVIRYKIKSMLGFL